ncbi:hypothetical protein FP382_22365, partial [Klebsiella quasipneumoniae]|nr:hypothetical protein [Klebsiella quasipneumoniae]
KACVLPENPASYRVVRTKSYLFNKAPLDLPLALSQSLSEAHSDDPIAPTQCHLFTILNPIPSHTSMLTVCI